MHITSSKETTLQIEKRDLFMGTRFHPKANISSIQYILLQRIEKAFAEKFALMDRIGSEYAYKGYFYIIDDYI